MAKKRINVKKLLSSWQVFYKEVFGIEIDLSKLLVPKHRPGFDRLIIVVQGMTPEKLFRKCQELFGAWKWTNGNLNKIVTSKRTAKDGPYAVWVRDRIEADKELKDLSTDDLKKKRIPCITLEERLLLELKFFKETGKHLDINNWTLCTGSRYRDSSIPSVGWHAGDRGMGVGWDYLDSSDDDLRARAVVA